MSDSDSSRRPTLDTHIEIDGRKVGPGEPVYIVAELSANHNQSFEEAVRLVRAAKDSGADAVKVQTYTPDTITIDCDNENFRIGEGTLWAGQTLYELYGVAYTPWDWLPELKKAANDLGLAFFSSAFDHTAVDALEDVGIAAHKVASFELVDLPLIEKMAATGRPLIMSTGMATLGEIDEAVRTARRAGAEHIALLKCTSAYPSPASEINLRTIPNMEATFGVPVGLSDHTLGIAVPVAAVAAGACLIEKHFTLSRDVPGPDSAFSLEPDEFKTMVDAVRVAEQALGEVRYEVTEREKATRQFRRSLYVVEDVEAGGVFDPSNVRSIRPGNGLHTRFLKEVVGRRASRAIRRGTPLHWDLIQ